MKFNLKPRPHHIPLIVVILVAITLSIGLVLTLLQKDSPAATGNLYLVPKSAFTSKDQDVTYTVRLFPGAPVDTVTATLTYDTSKLAYKSVSYKDSPFSVQIPAINKPGSLTIQSAKFNGNITQDSLVAAVIFTALDGGTQNVTLNGNAAHAGIATHPAINGVPNEDINAGAVACDAADCPKSSNSAQDSTTVPANAANGLTQNVLKAVGVSPASARRAAPWLMGVAVCMVVGAGIALFLILRRRRHTLQSSNDKKIQDNTEKTDETA